MAQSVIGEVHMAADFLKDDNSYLECDLPEYMKKQYQAARRREKKSQFWRKILAA